MMCKILPKIYIYYDYITLLRIYTIIFLYTFIRMLQVRREKEEHVRTKWQQALHEYKLS